MQPLNKPQAIDAIDGALGELSMFHQTYGFYVHGVSIEAATLPTGWKSRTIKVSDAVGTRAAALRVYPYVRSVRPKRPVRTEVSEG